MNRRRLATALEKKAAKRWGGTATLNSGATWRHKGDFVTDRFRGEHKYTEKKSFSLQRAVIEKIEREALLDGRDWMVHVEFHEHEYGCSKEVVVVDANLFDRLLRDAGWL